MNKEELKEEVGKLNLVETEFEADGLSYMDGGVSLTQVYDLIDRLDEQEVLSQEWMKDNQLMKISPEGVVYYVPVENLQNLLVPKQELPVIPKYVADWWGRDGDSVTMYGGESIDKKRKIHLISNFNDRGLGDHLSKVEDWIDENESSFLDLVNGKVYEVEKEKLYYVIDKSRKPLLKAFKEEVSMSVCNVTVEEAEALEYPNFKYKLTEKQIKDYDERYWDFVQPVEEEE